MRLEDIHRAYFIGIGGIGMSALARWLKWKGVEVSGYDRTETKLTDELIQEGMVIHFEEDVNKVKREFSHRSDTLIVYTPAVPSSHKELSYFRSEGFEVLKRSELLGQVSKEIKTIAVAGTHGKTTTTSMIAHILNFNKVNATALVGGILSNYNSNLILSGDPNYTEWMVVEADEFDRSFLTLRPEIAIITSVDADHLDIYGEGAHLSAAFGEFSSRIVEGGKLFIHHKANGLIDPAKFETGTRRTYGIADGDFRAKNFTVNGNYHFDLVSNDHSHSFELSIPGRHNIENAIAAIVASHETGLDYEQIEKALSSYQGVKRRFEYIIRNENLIYIDDYAHHPTEIEALISSVRELYPNRKITAVFQPHLFSRTRDFLEGFARSLDMADQVFLLDIYPAREEPISGINSERILKKMDLKEKRLVAKEELLQILPNQELEILLTVGAGDIDMMVEPIKEALS